MKSKASQTGEIDWNVAKLFPDKMDVGGGRMARRIKYALSKVNGETVAYYMMDASGLETHFLYILREGKPVMLEQYPSRPNAANRARGFFISSSY